MAHRIVWSSEATGTEETAFVGSLRDAHRAARKMIGEVVYVDQVAVGKVESAYVVDENGNPL